MGLSHHISATPKMLATGTHGTSPPMAPQTMQKIVFVTRTFGRISPNEFIPFPSPGLNKKLKEGWLLAVLSCLWLCYFITVPTLPTKHIKYFFFKITNFTIFFIYFLFLLPTANISSLEFNINFLSRFTTKNF